MELALYAPGLGYYSGGAAKLGKDGDFTTAPELSALFGQALAHVAAAIMAQSAPHILEFGAGTGKLAKDMLTELAAAGVAVESYAIIELSGELRARQQELLRGFPQVRWLDALPQSFQGAVVGNEVLDAMPVDLVTLTDDGWQSLHVASTQAGFAWRPTAADAALQAQIARQIPDAEQLPVGYVTEVHGAGCAFMTTLASMLAQGKGAAGTLMCHYRHHAHAEPFYLPGLQDITAHVDFTAMALAAQDAGADVLAYASQAGFLIGAGIGDLLLRHDPADALNYLPHANALQKLLSPAEMGELFKVLVVGHGVELPQQLLLGDRSHRL
jgi:SAM-dependent MidA family methyltransferase